jgi:hypothetical protein
MLMQTYMSLYADHKDDGGNDWSIVEATVSGAECSAIADDRPRRSLARSISMESEARRTLAGHGRTAEE